MGVAMDKPHPYVVNNAFPGPWESTSNFGLIGLQLTFQPKLLPVGTAMAKPHPLPWLHVFNNAHSGSCRVHAKSAFLVQVFGCDAYIHIHTNMHTLTNQNMY